jgi:hypothetical protein
MVPVACGICPPLLCFLDTVEVFYTPPVLNTCHKFKNELVGDMYLGSEEVVVIDSGWREGPLGNPHT